jgi:hypothetical protein
VQRVALDLELLLGCIYLVFSLSILCLKSTKIIFLRI